MWQRRSNTEISKCILMEAVNITIMMLEVTCNKLIRALFGSQ